MYLLCRGPGPHTPTSGIIGEAANDESQPWCGECVARVLRLPPGDGPIFDDGPMLDKLDAVVDRLNQLTDAVEQLILNDLMSSMGMGDLDPEMMGLI